MYKVIKRCFDFWSALLLLIIISPVFVVLSIIVRFNLGSPIFFFQERTGMGLKPFKLIKFRSMTDAKDSQGAFLPDHLRVTKFGRLLRSTSLDELPELFNIIRGDMSVIGPRPLLPKYDSYYTEEERIRFQVRGGLITPDSVDENPIISWDKQLWYESQYAKNVSFWLDCRIFFSVFKILLRRTEKDYGSFERKPLDLERAYMHKNK